MNNKKYIPFYAVLVFILAGAFPAILPIAIIAGAYFFLRKQTSPNDESDTVSPNHRPVGNLDGRHEQRPAQRPAQRPVQRASQKSASPAQNLAHRTHAPKAPPAILPKEDYDDYDSGFMKAFYASQSTGTELNPWELPPEKPPWER